MSSSSTISNLSSTNQQVAKTTTTTSTVIGSSWKRTRDLFDDANDTLSNDVFIPVEDSTIYNASIERRRRQRLLLQQGVKNPQQQQQQQQQTPSLSSSALIVHADDTTTGTSTNTVGGGGVLSIIPQQHTTVPHTKKYNTNHPVLTIVKPASTAQGGSIPSSTSQILVNRDPSSLKSNVPVPKWQTPWKLATVLSSHLGWVRCIGMTPDNTMFGTGSADRTIKIWNLPKASVGASDALLVTLTGHISPVRAVVFSNRHPYLFSAAEDKTIKCWDLETNQVVRHYHGHLSGVYSLSLHPILDVLVSGGRDAVGRVWDIRTKHQIHVLSGHEHTISSVQTKTTHPQILTASHDCTIKMWDLAAGKCVTTLTHHTKAVRALTIPTFENTFVSGATDCLKKWQGKDGKFLHSIHPLPETNANSSKDSKLTSAKRDVIVHTVSVNDDGVLVSGYDDGTIQLYDYNTGYNFQSITSRVQPGSLQEAENAVLTTSFDLTGTRLITGEADKTIKIYQPIDNETPTTYPVRTTEWRKQYIKSIKERY